MTPSSTRALRIPIASSVLARLRDPSTFLFAGLMLGNGFSYLYQVFLARALRPADYGVVVTFTSASTVLLVVTRTIQAWVTEAVSPGRDPNGGPGFAEFSTIVRTVLLVGGVVFALHVVASHWIASFLQLGSTTPIVLLGLYAVTSFLVAVPRGSLLGLDRFYSASLVYAVEPFARLLTGIGFVVWGLSLTGALAGFSAGSFLAFAIALVPLWPTLRRQRDTAPRLTDLAGLDRYAVLALGVNVGLVVISSVDQIAVKHYFSATVAGNYSVAFLLGRVISMTTISLAWVVFARSAIMPFDDPGRPRLLLKGLLATGAISVLFTLGYLVSPALPVRLLGGSQYATASNYVGLVGIETTLFSLVFVQAYYQLSVRKTTVIWPLSVATVLAIVLLGIYHASVQQVLLTLIVVLTGLLLAVSLLSWRVLREGRQAWARDRDSRDPIEGVAMP